MTQPGGLPGYPGLREQRGEKIRKKEESVKRRTFLGAAAAALALGAGGGAAFLGQEKFGALPEGDELLRIKASPNYVDGEFCNLIPRPVLSDGSSLAGTFFRFLLKKRASDVQPRRVPSQKPDFRALQHAGDTLVWLGHSSFYLQLGGRRLLIDPVLGDHASPVSFRIHGQHSRTIRSFPPKERWNFYSLIRWIGT